MLTSVQFCRLVKKWIKWYQGPVQIEVSILCKCGNVKFRNIPFKSHFLRIENSFAIFPFIVFSISSGVVLPFFLTSIPYLAVSTTAYLFIQIVEHDQPAHTCSLILLRTPHYFIISFCCRNPIQCHLTNPRYR